MAFQVADRVQESVSTSGTGTFSLGGAVAGYSAFSSACATSDTVCYCATVSGGGWEVGAGTYTTGSPNTLSRTTIYANSAGTLVAISLATPNVFLTMPAFSLKKVYALDQVLQSLGTI